MAGAAVSLKEKGPMEPLVCYGDIRQTNTLMLEEGLTPVCVALF